MASVQEQVAARGENGAAATATKTIDVEKPATGEVIAQVPDLGREQVAEMARLSRAAQPGWEALGFEGRGRGLLRMQRWVADNAERIIRTIVSETGKTWEDAQLAEVNYALTAFGFWPKHAEEYLAEERVKTANVMLKSKRLVLRYRPVGLVGVIGPWNYPLTNGFGDCVPAPPAGHNRR